MLFMTRERRVRKLHVDLRDRVPQTFLAPGDRVEFARTIGSASVVVMGYGVFHAVVLQEVGSVVVVVEVFPTPEVPLDDLARSDATLVGVFAVAVSAAYYESLLEGRAR